MRFRPLLALVVLAIVPACSGDGYGAATPVITRVTVSSGGPSLLPGQTVQLTATAFDADGAVVANPGTYAWSSSNTAVATVDQSGKVTTVAQGQTEVRAALPNVSGKALVVVNPAAGVYRGLPAHRDR